GAGAVPVESQYEDGKDDEQAEQSGQAPAEDFQGCRACHGKPIAVIFLSMYFCKKKRSKSHFLSLSSVFKTILTIFAFNKH
ncbi:MAG: hypothetical protein RR416_06295, partial [Clostridia bacterium]